MYFVIPVVILCVLVLAAAAAVICRMFFGKFTAKKGFTVTAHSGCMGFPDNSIEAMEEGIKAGAEIVEFDLNYTEDGSPVLSHDRPKAGSDCVPLEEAFAFLAAHPGIKANVDVKSTDYLEKVKPLSDAAGVTDRIFFTGIHDGFVQAAKEKGAGIPYYLNTAKIGFHEIKHLADKVEAAGAIGININHARMSPALSREMHKRGLLVSVWTVNTENKARYILGMNPDNITSRRPDIICSLTSGRKTDE